MAKSTSRSRSASLEDGEEGGRRGDIGGQSPSGEPSIDDLGLTVASIDARVREHFELAKDAKGVVVTEVDRRGPSAAKGIRPGDVIVEVSQHEVTSPADIAERIIEAREAGRKTGPAADSKARRAAAALRGAAYRRLTGGEGGASAREACVPGSHRSAGAPGKAGEGSGFAVAFQGVPMTDTVKFVPPRRPHSERLVQHPRRSSGAAAAGAASGDRPAGLRPDDLAPLFPMALIAQEAASNGRSRSPSRCARSIGCGARRRSIARAGWSRRSIHRPGSTTNTKASARPEATSRTRPCRRPSTTSRKAPNG